MKKLLITISVTFSLFIIAIIFRNYFWFGEVRIIGLDNYTYASIDDEEISYDSNEIILRVRPGNYTIYLHGPLVESAVNSIVTVDAFNTVTIDSGAEVMTDDELVRKLALYENEINGVVLSKHFLSNDKKWLVARFYAVDGSREGYTNIYQFTPSNGWKVVESGTGIDPDALRKAQMPEEIIKFIGGNL